MGELSTRGCPTAAVLLIVLGNVDCVVHEGHTIVCRLMLEIVAVLLTEVDDGLNNLRRGIWNLDRVRLNMRDSVTKFLLHVMLEVNHEQGSTLRDNIVDVARVLAGVVELGARQTVYRVDNDLQSKCQGIRVNTFLNKRHERSIEEIFELVELIVLYQDTGLLNVTESLGVGPKQVQLLKRCRMHRRDIQ